MPAYPASVLSVAAPLLPPRCPLLLLVCALGAAPVRGDTVVYRNDFNGPTGSRFPEWSCAGYTWSGDGRSGDGPQAVTNVDSPNRAQRFLGEFGGAAIVHGPPFVRVEQTVTLTLANLPPHASVKVAFDLYVLKSWDGNNAIYGPDRWRLAVAGGRVLLDTTFSNNPKTGRDYSPQDYPAAGSAFRSGAVRVNSLGYKFFGDAIYPLTFTLPHSGDTLALNFSSSLFEGKGTDDESWGLDNIVVTVGDATAADISPQRTQSAQRHASPAP